MIGDLSPDQARYVATVAAGTGLDPTVVTSWVGSESPWGSTKPDHNYLNVGPGENYASVDVAAARVVDLINSNSQYAPVKLAVPSGPAAQIAAIKASPWDANHYGGGTLDQVFTQLHGAGGGQVLTDPMAATVGFSVPDWAKGVLGGVLGVLDPAKSAEKIAGVVLNGGLSIGLTLLLAAAGVGLVVLGLNRLTGSSVKERFEQVSSTVGTVSQAAALAAM